MDEEQIYNLLDSGWIYCKYDPYFEKAFFRHVKKKKKFGKGGYFVLKTQRLYDWLVSLGMPENTEEYDRCIILIMNRYGDDGMVKMHSLNTEGEVAELTLKKIAHILKAGFEHL